MIRNETYDELRSLIRLFGYRSQPNNKKILFSCDSDDEIILDTNNTASGVVINSIQDYGSFSIALRHGYVKINEKHQDSSKMIESVNGSIVAVASEVIEGKLHTTRLTVDMDSITIAKSVYADRDVVKRSKIKLSLDGDVHFSASNQNDSVLIDKKGNDLVLGSGDDSLSISLNPIQRLGVITTLVDDEIAIDLNDSIEYLDSKLPGLRQILEERYDTSDKLFFLMAQDDVSSVNTLLSGYKAKFKEIKESKDKVISIGTCFNKID